MEKGWQADYNFIPLNGGFEKNDLCPFGWSWAAYAAGSCPDCPVQLQLRHLNVGTFACAGCPSSPDSKSVQSVVPREPSSCLMSALGVSWTLLWAPITLLINGTWFSYLNMSISCQIWCPRVLRYLSASCRCVIGPVGNLCPAGGQSESPAPLKQYQLPTFNQRNPALSLCWLQWELGHPAQVST